MNNPLVSPINSNIYLQRASKVLQQILMIHITKSIVYRCINFLFPVFHEGNKPLSKIANQPV